MTNEKRLTAKQVALTLSELAEKAVVMPVLPTHGAYEHAKEIVRDNLVPRWQDEPDGDGWYWVEGLDGIALCYQEDTAGNPWAIELVETDPGTLVSVLRWEPLNNRRVCQIGERPEAGE